MFSSGPGQPLFFFSLSSLNQYLMKTIERIAILGGGNLGRSLALGLDKAAHYDPDTVWMTRRKAHRLTDLAERGFRTGSDNAQAVRESDLVILGVQPGQMPGLLEDILPVLDPERHIVVSLAAGLTLPELREWIPPAIPLYRAMPNTAVALCESMTCIATRDESDERRAAVTGFFQGLGQALVIEETLMASATVLGACGIAFALRFIRAASQGGTEIGFEAETAQLIATQTVKGAAALLLEGGNHPEHEIDKVTTPRGCTIAGLNQMEHQGFSSALIRGITTSHERIEKL